MDTFALEIIKQIPSLGVLCFIVVVFVRYMEKRDIVIREIHADHLTERQAMRLTIETNTKAMADNTHALKDVARVVNEGNNKG